MAYDDHAYRFLTLPPGGITKTMLEASAQALLVKAGTALQSVNGLTGDSAGNVVITGTTGGGGGTGTINGSFYPIFNLKDYGWTGTGTTNDFTYVKQAWDAAYAVGGGIIYAGAGIINLANATSAQLELVAGSSAFIAFRGAGKWATTVRLSSNCPTFVSTSTATGLGTMHGNFSMQDVTIDNNNIGTPSGKMFGMAFAVQSFRTSLQNISFKSVDLINGTKLVSGTGRRSVDMTIVSTTNDPTDTYTCQNIHFEDCDFGRGGSGGGNYQIQIQGWGGGAAPSILDQQTKHRQYVYFDNIYLRRVRAVNGFNMSTLTTFIGTTNIMVGGYGYGGTLIMEHIYTEGSGDDSIETGAFDTIIMNDVTCKDAWSSLIYIRNIGGVLPYAGKQNVRMTNIKTINQFRSSTGIYLHSTAGEKLGHITIDGHTHESIGASMLTSTNAIAWSGGITYRGDSPKVSIRNFKMKFLGFDHAFTVNNQSKVGAAIGIEQIGGTGIVDIDGVSVEGYGNLTGGSFTGCSYGFRTIDVAGAVDLTLRIRGVSYQSQFTKTGNGTYSISLVSFGGTGSPAPSDSFSTLGTSIAEWYYCDTSNVSDVAIASGVLTSVANHTAEKRFRWISITNGNSQTIGPYIDGAPKMTFTYSRTSGHKGGVLHGVDATNYIEAYITDDGTNSVLHLDKIVAGTRTALGTPVTLGARIADATPYWVRSIIRENTVYAEYFTSDPGTGLGTTGASTITATLLTTDINLFGAQALKRPGFVWVPAVATATADTMAVVRQNVISAHIEGLVPQTLLQNFWGTATGIAFNNDKTIIRFRQLDVNHCDFQAYTGIPTINEFGSTLTGTSGWGEKARIRDIKYVNPPAIGTGAAPTTGTWHQNTTARDEQVSFFGTGTITSINFSRDGGTTSTQVLAGPGSYLLKSGESIQANYTGSITMTTVPWR